MVPEQPYNEQELLQRVAAGDEQAFTVLFKTYHPVLAAYIWSWTKSMVLTEEMVQDVFTKIWKNREQLAAVKQFRSFLFIISRNHTFNCLRQIARERSRQQEWEYYVQHTSTAAETLPGEYTELIGKAIEQLPPQQRKVYLLRRDAWKFEEIGRQMQISPETARKHMGQAVRSISKYVHAYKNAVALSLILPLFFS